MNYNRESENYSGLRAYGSENVDLGVANWIFIFVLLVIPCVNVFMIIKWAFFTSDYDIKQNFSRALLFFGLVGFVLGVILNLLLSIGAATMGMF